MLDIGGTHFASVADRRLRVSAEIQVFLVEDEASLKRSLVKYLEWAGYPFECCSTARDVLVLAERLDPDIVIAEYHLPDANGLALLEKLTRMLPDVAAILLSEYDFQVVAKDLSHVKVLTFLKIPFVLRARKSEVKVKVGQECSRRTKSWIRRYNRLTP
jgi:DNA-binding NtrC family response regulator